MSCMRSIRMSMTFSSRDEADFLGSPPKAAFGSLGYWMTLGLQIPDQSKTHQNLLCAVLDEFTVLPQVKQNHFVVEVC